MLSFMICVMQPSLGVIPRIYLYSLILLFTITVQRSLFTALEQPPKP